MDVNDPRRPPCGEDVAPYVLGALSPDEARAFEQHLAGCELCRADLDALRPAVHALGETPEQVAPPRALKRRIMAVVEQEAAERRRAEAPATAPRRRRPSWLRPLPALALATFVLVAGIGIGVIATGDDPRTYTERSDGVTARLELEDDGGRLVVHGMDRLAPDRVMQVWLVRGAGGRPEPTDALFTPNRDGTASVAVPGDLEDVTRVMVSEEPRGGSEQPTTAPVLDFDVESA